MLKTLLQHKNTGLSRLVLYPCPFFAAIELSFVVTDWSELCIHFSKISMCFYSSISQFTFIFTNIALIPHTIMFYRTRRYRSKKGSWIIEEKTRSREDTKKCSRSLGYAAVRDSTLRRSASQQRGGPTPQRTSEADSSSLGYAAA